MSQSANAAENTSMKDTIMNTKPNDASDVKIGPVVARSRRALGDITNASDSEPSEYVVTKKPTLTHSSIQVTETTEETVQQASSMVQSMDESIKAEEGDRSYMKRATDDIDSRDDSNPVYVTEYVNGMYDLFRETEKEFLVDGQYMLTTQIHINEKMRAILVDWLVDVHIKFTMVPETLYMAVSLIDRYLSLKQVRRSRLQLVGVAALLMASKYEEIYPPELKKLVYITDRAYTKHEILEMETLMLTAFDYQLTVPTVHSFLCRYLKAAHADRQMVQMTCYLAERSLQEYSCIKHLPSIVAASAVLVARKSLNRHPWSPTLLTYTGYDEEHLAACVEEIGGIAQNASRAPQLAVYKKYSQTKFGSVAKLSIVY